MADMRQIFTYPNNLATDYIDPNYVGDAFTGMTRRIDQLIDGTYKTWLNPLVLTATTSEVMQNISKFGSFYENVSYGGHLSRYDFWNQPMVVATKRLVTSFPLTPTAGADVQASPMRITFSGPHEFVNDMRIQTSGIDGTWGQFISAGRFPEMYAEVLSPTEIEIKTDLTGSTPQINFAPGGSNFTLPYGAWDYFTPLAGSSDQNNCKYLRVNLTHILDAANSPYDIQILDGQAVTVNGYATAKGVTSPTDAKIEPRTYYVKNTPTSPSDGWFEVYNEPALTNRIEFVDDASAGSGVTLPLHNGNGYSVQINETNPATLTFTDLLTSKDHVIRVEAADAIQWTLSGITTEKYFGPLNNNLNPVYWLIPTTDPYTFRFSTVPPTSSVYPQMPNWSSQTFDVITPYQEFSQLAQPQNSTSRPWAQVNNARIKWLKGINNGGVENYLDGTPADLSSNSLAPGEFWNDPYYLKNIPSLETATYKVFDVFKDSAMTQLYGLNDYLSPGAPISISPIANQPNLAFTTSMGNNPPTTNYTLSKFEADADYPQWDINTGDDMTATWDGSQWNVTSHYPVGGLTLNDEAQGAPGPDNVSPFYYGGGADYSEGFFWAYQSIGTSNSGTTCFLNIANSEGTLNRVVNARFDIGITPGGAEERTVRFDPTTGTNKIWYKWYGGTPSTDENVEFQPVPGSGSKVNLISALTERYWTVGINGPTSLPSVNSGGYHTSQASPATTWLTETAAPGTYDAIDGTGTYFLYPTGVTGPNTKEYGVYSNRNHSGGTNGIDKFDFSPNNKTYTGINARWDWPANPAGSGENGWLPVGVDLSGTNFKFEYSGVTGSSSSNEWTDGTEVRLRIYGGPHNRARARDVYLKVNTDDWEFFTDSALTIPWTSQDFTEDYNYVNDTSYPYDQPVSYAYSTTTFYITAKEKVRSLNLGSTNSPTYNPWYGGKTITSNALTNGTEVFDFKVYNQASTTISTEITNAPLTTSTNVIPANIELQNTAIALPHSDSTTGTVGPHPSSAVLPYEIDTVSLILPGNQKYHYRNANNQVVPGAQANTSKYWKAGSSTPSYYTNGATPPDFTVTVDTDGYLQDVQLVQNPGGQEGTYPTGQDIMILIENKTDEYVPLPETPAQIAAREDLFDTHDEWVDNAPSNEKVWPNHISPASANIVANQPTIANMSQNGVKYTRSSGFTKWILEVEYPPMKAKDFQKFHAMAQAMAGQSKSIYFKLRNADGVSILWADMMDTNSALSGVNIPTAPLFGYTPQGSLTLHLEGLTASDPEAFRQGEVFIAGTNENGSLHTAIGAAASNVFGEAKVRMPYGIRSNLADSALVYKNPFWAIVTLNSDAFEYSVDVNNYYTVSVAFDLDQWGS